MIGKRTLYYNKIDLNNGKVERKKRIYGNDDEKYEGSFRSNKREGKEISYSINGDKEMWDYLSNKKIWISAKLNDEGKFSTNHYNLS